MALIKMKKTLLLTRNKSLVWLCLAHGLSLRKHYLISKWVYWSSWNLYAHTRQVKGTVKVVRNDFAECGGDRKPVRVMGSRGVMDRCEFASSALFELRLAPLGHSLHSVNFRRWHPSHGLPVDSVARSVSTRSDRSWHRAGGCSAP